MSEQPIPPGGRAFEPLPQAEAYEANRHTTLSLDGLTLLVGTKKGAFFLTANASRERFQLSGPAFLGHIVHHAVLDPRDRRTLLLAIRTGHLGPTVFRSTDFGKTWQEAAKPPAFSKPKDARRATVVEQVFWLTPGHADEAGVWYAGTSPEGLFRSEDGGNTWQPVAGWNDHPKWIAWTGDMTQRNPDGSPVHSILVDPRDPRHMYFATGSAGVFESIDQGADWNLLNTGMRSPAGPDPFPEYGYDPHCMTLHPRDPKTAWVFPMDGTDVWPRTCPAGRPAIYRTHDGGDSWTRLDRGFPERAWYTVLRQSMAVDDSATIGVYFGTTNGEIWGSIDAGDSWRCLASHLPHVYSLEVAQFAR